MINLAEVWDLIRTGGVPFVLWLWLFGYYKKWWVPGWLYTREYNRAQRMEDAVWRLSGVSERVLPKILLAHEEREGE